MHQDDSNPEVDHTSSERHPIRRRTEPAGRAQRFMAAYGWRAYAVPVLAIATVIALIGVLESPKSKATDTTSATSSASGPSESTSTETQPSVTPPPSQEAPATSIAAAPTADYLQAGDGNLNIVPGTSGIYGTAGPLVTYDVEIEGGISIDAAAFALEVERILGDPRSWIAEGQFTLQRVDTADAALHVTLVTPDHVEGYCPEYQTGGFTSCRYGDQVVINLARWSVGVDDYSGFLAEYREYVVNHEVGHYFGHGHVPCPGAGMKAPVMQQQTLGLEGCLMNAWPYPNGPGGDVNAPA